MLTAPPGDGGFGRASFDKLRTGRAWSRKLEVGGKTVESVVRGPLSVVKEA